MGDHVGFTIFLYATSTPGNIVMLIFLQGAMKYYDQIEVIPMYVTSSLIFTIVSGMIMLNEIADYSPGQLVGIFFGIVICIPKSTPPLPHSVICHPRKAGGCSSHAPRGNNNRVPRARAMRV